MAKATARRTAPSYVRLTPFVRVVMYGFFLAGYIVDETREDVVKPDGAAPSRQTIAETIRVAAARGGNLRDDASCGGREAPQHDGSRGNSDSVRGLRAQRERESDRRIPYEGGAHELCTSQEAEARDVLDAQGPGSRTRH